MLVIMLIIVFEDRIRSQKSEVGGRRAKGEAGRTKSRAEPDIKTSWLV
jgi:hypothetical protein